MDEHREGYHAAHRIVDEVPEYSQVDEKEPATPMTTKQRIMNRMQRRREGGITRHAAPAARTGQPQHRVAWATASDQRLVLDAIRYGLVRTGEQRTPWGRDGFFPTRKALYVAVEKARAAGWEQTEAAQAMAQAVEDRWRTG